MEDKEIIDEKINNEESVISNNDSKRIVKNILIVAISNFIKLLSGILVGFIIPKIMGDMNYGYYKTYTLYLGYVGLFPLGFIDGIYLIYAGANYDKLDKKSFRFYSKFILIFQMIVAILICSISLLFIKNDYGFIFLFLGISLLGNNITGYYQQISQITGRFKELSLRNIIQAVLQILSVVICFLLWRFGVIDELHYKLYIIIWTAILSLLSIWYIFTYRQITFGESSSFKKEKKKVFKFFITGFPLMIANIVSSLILSIDKQFVSVLTNKGVYSIGQFGVYSFAYTMLSIITTVIVAISTVLYPTIKTYTEDRLKNDYSKLISIIAIVTSACLLSYQPLCFIVNNWLEKYMESLPIFRAILPGVILSSCVTMIMFNYYKTMGKQFLFFIISVITLFVSLGANFIAYFSTGKMIWISIASVIVIGIWYLASEFYIIKKWKINPIKNILYISLIIISFYFITYFIANIFISFALYFVIFLILTFIFYFPLLKKRFR